MYGSLREKIAAEGAERKSRYATFEAVYNEAAEAGRKAGESAVPAPMTVYGGVPGEPPKVWHEPEGACGFAWVTIRPATGSFARWLKKQKLARTAYGGGMQIWISAFNQSVARKEACANAMAAVFRAKLGVAATADSRLD